MKELLGELVKGVDVSWGCPLRVGGIVVSQFLVVLRGHLVEAREGTVALLFLFLDPLGEEVVVVVHPLFDGEFIFVDARFFAGVFSITVGVEEIGEPANLFTEFVDSGDSEGNGEIVPFGVRVLSDAREVIDFLHDELVEGSERLVGGGECMLYFFEMREVVLVLGNFIFFHTDVRLEGTASDSHIFFFTIIITPGARRFFVRGPHGESAPHG